MMLRRWLAIGLALLLITHGLAPLAAAWAGEEGGARDGDGAGRAMRVAASSLNLRAGAGTGQSVLRSLPQGTAVTVVEERGEWSRVRLSDGTEGWVAAKYLEPVEPAGAPDAPGERERPTAAPDRQPDRAARTAASGGGGGGSTLRAIAKWGCLAGAVVAGGLWYSERSSGDDAYDEYKQLYHAGEIDAAEEKYTAATDHDDQAQTYAIVGGVLLGLFALQQFVLGGGGDDQAAGPESPQPWPIAWNPHGGGVRVALVRASF